MNWNDCSELSKEWIKLGQNAPETVFKFIKTDADEVEAGEEKRIELAGKVFEIIKMANCNAEVETLREMFPPAHDPFIEMLDTVEQVIDSVVIHQDDIFFRVKINKTNALVYSIHDNKVSVVENLKIVGVSNSREYYAFVYDKEIKLYLNDNSVCKIVLNAKVKSYLKRGIISVCPYNNGDKILIVTVDTILELSINGEHTILYQEDDASMIHASLSANDRFVALGSQDSDHIIMDLKYYEESECIEPTESYPDFALYNQQGNYVLMNSCYMYDGASIILGMNTDDIGDVDLKVRLTAGTSFNEEFIVGDVDGNIYAINTDGKVLWTYYVGSTVDGLYVSKDGSTLLVGTFAGMLIKLKLKYDNGLVSDILEERRWLIWKNEPQIYEW